MHGTDAAVLVPQDHALCWVTMDSCASIGVVGLAYPLTPKFPLRAVSPSTSSSNGGLACAV